jgi:hypothetical protein
MPQTPLLDLTTMLLERQRIRIDGTLYELRSPEELSVLQSARFTRWGGEIERLGQSLGGADHADRDAELTALLRQVAAAALVDVPAAVIERLSGGQAMSIVEVFTTLLLGKRLRLAGALVAQVADRQTGPSSSPGSSAAMAATPDTGSSAARQPC